MGADVIRVDHDAMGQVANKFEQNSQKMAQMLQELQRPYQSLKDGGWIGQGATAFYAEMDSKIIPSLQRLIQALSQAGKSTNDISGVMRNADQEASSNFKDNGAGNGSAGGMAGAAGGALGSGLGMGAGMGGLGGALGGGGGFGGGDGGFGGGFSSPSGFSGSGGFGGGSSGLFPQTNLGGMGRGFDMFGGSGSGAGVGQSAGAAAKFHYQPVAGMAGTTQGGPGGLQFGSAGGLISSLSGGGLGAMPVIMAVATPFVAMLGKAIKSRMDGS